MSENKPFEGRVALVTGASRGIGAAVAQELAAKGAHVILTARDDAALEQVEDAIHNVGGTATIAPVDLGESDGVARLAQAIASRWDALDFLVISAAYLPTLTPVTQIDPKQFNTAITTNILATQALLAAFHPLLKRADAARVIGLTSSVGEAPRAYWAAYGSTKAAFDNLLLAYGQEVANTGPVRVAVIDPGATRTQMRAKAYPGEDPQTVKPPQEVAVHIAQLLENDFETGHRERVG
ncbi:SDR family NAD(P)-dependent oxidoreductase [Alteriqipengyuania lutimaris]|uniref:SDR family NAD(P)-dependent oxidoreductase n=1 Tax=Alteriqipengyuania lutimaris TaxID=1538146 RepID=A0A395LME2_9SPHN|nr:SDR family NAD(P)-dependent oxidoreductase [Alteriqipengyuania lutimaris]MBB3032725.1 NAD(P)-dependent dehydrogenase (short-subunit alcohol dehydrogenase family) [Alteriqipengyuania lutimaris]RDS78168.1 SDR family NAD(P)-dependent oxidoreductase [Alteriqipengyuania lutimaris]